MKSIYLPLITLAATLVFATYGWAASTLHGSSDAASRDSSAKDADDSGADHGEKTIGEVSEIANSIASAVEQQGAATQEIARNVQQAAQGTQDVSENIVGVTQGAGQNGKAATEVMDAVKQLTVQSDGLKSAVETYLGDVKAA